MNLEGLTPLAYTIGVWCVRIFYVFFWLVFAIMVMYLLRLARKPKTLERSDLALEVVFGAAATGIYLLLSDFTVIPLSWAAAAGCGAFFGLVFAFTQDVWLEDGTWKTRSQLWSIVLWAVVVLFAEIFLSNIWHGFQGAVLAVIFLFSITCCTNFGLALRIRKQRT
ncbi:MAG TPA: hypothetical protein PKL83_04415 [bacterium]|nr:hypothetical protein [bacterium]